MEKFIGTITYELKAKESKSEGYFAFLTLGTADVQQSESPQEGDGECDIEGEEKTYQLYRTGVYAVNDSFFEPYNNMMVELEGVIMLDTWIDVKSIKELKIE